MLSPRESGKFVASLAEHVKINEKAVKILGDQLIEEVNSGRLSTANFSQNNVHPKPDNPKALDWLLVVDTLNFCFWHHENEEGWKVEGYTGYFALCAAVNRAVMENVDILNPKYYSTITEEQLKKVLRSDTKVEISLLTERVKCLHEVGAVLLERFDSSFMNVVKQAENSAAKLLKLIVENFSCFKDEAVYKNTWVSFYKRAQILVGDVWSCFQNKGLGYFKDISEITMFADYRVPQTLLWYHVFEYSDELIAKLNNNVILRNGDSDEIEIRGCSIHAVELIVDYAKVKLGDQINSILVDHFLWDFRRKHAKEISKNKLPYHKVYCIYY